LINCVNSEKFDHWKSDERPLCFNKNELHDSLSVSAIDESSRFLAVNLTLAGYGDASVDSCPSPLLASA
jgi:hypothetical protein